MGVVLNRQQQYVWERGNRQESYQANLDEVPDVVLSGTIDENTLQQSLGADYTVMNLTGCSLDSVLYQVSKGNPVIAKVSDTVNVVIIGYNSKIRSCTIRQPRNRVISVCRTAPACLKAPVTYLSAIWTILVRRAKANKRYEKHSAGWLTVEWLQ